jgi:hypothetical protein
VFHIPGRMNLKLLYSVAMALHGIGHALGIVVFLNLGGMSVARDSWGLDQGLIKTLSFIWIIPFTVFITVAWGVWTGTTWWNTLAWIGILVSVIYFILYCDSFPSNVPVQANIGNIVALAALLGLFKLA